MEGGRERELMRDALPLSAPLPGPELASRLLRMFTDDIHANVVMFAERPPTYPRLIPSVRSFDGISGVLSHFLAAAEADRARAASCTFLGALIFDGRGG